MHSLSFGKSRERIFFQLWNIGYAGEKGLRRNRQLFDIHPDIVAQENIFKFYVNKFIIKYASLYALVVKKTMK